MIADNRRVGSMIVVMSLLFVSIGYGKTTKIETTTTTSSLTEPTISEENSQKDSEGESEKSWGIFPVEKLHDVIREERTEVLLEINKERKAILVYLTQERRAVVDKLKTELNRFTDLLQSERRATMVEMEAIGNRIVENAILKSERLIDHFFIRAIQLALIIILAFSILGFIIFRIVAKRKSKSL
jgi:hypothetical protein